MTRIPGKAISVPYKQKTGKMHAFALARVI